MIHQISEKFKETKEGILKNCMWWTIKRRIQFLRKGTATSASRFREIFLKHTDNIMLIWSGICVSFSVFHATTSSYQFQSGCQESEKPLQIIACNCKKESGGREGQANLSLAGHLSCFCETATFASQTRNIAHHQYNMGFKEFICPYLIGTHSPMDPNLEDSFSLKVPYQLKRTNQWSSGVLSNIYRAGL